MTTPARILVAMSGGVDSAVAAALLRDQGHEIIGIHMRVWRHPADTALQRPRHVTDAEAVARRLDIPFHVFDLEREFERDVIAPFIAAYRRGRTPIPCVLCNERLKLGHLIRSARRLGAETVATGHYVRCGEDAEGRPRLRRPHCRPKDQTYYLFRFTPEQRAMLRAPLGDMVKDDVRAIARDLGLPVADKPDSAEICFIPDDDYRRFLRERLDADDPALQPGPILDTAGAQIGTHRGIAHHTVGQRRGLGISAPRPLYVTAIDVERRAIIVGEEEETRGDHLTATDVTWHEPPETLAGRRLMAQIRATHPAAPCRLTPTVNGFSLQFEEPQRAITPGQAAVVFDETDETIVAGGWIER